MRKQLAGIAVRLLALALLSCSLAGCYSFTGASVPAHLKTLQIPTVEDRSGFGDAPRYRSVLTEMLIDQFQNDNSFTLETENADALLEVAIVNVRDDIANVGEGEIENERKLTVTIKAVYTDQVKNIQVWDKTIAGFEFYEAGGGTAARDAAVEAILERLAEDTLLEVVSGW